MSYFTDRRTAKLIKEELDAYGFSIGEPTCDAARGKVFLTLIRGLLVFLSAYGVIGGLCSSFDLPYDPLRIGVMLFLISVTIAFIYYNRFTFYAGYVLLFLAFLVLYVTAYAYINSGFQAFLNQVYSAYGDFFILPSTRETTEYITDRTVTVPAAMLFTGAGFAILLNISISAYMDIFTTFLVTFLPLQIAFYIDIIPPLPYLIMLITVYITVTVLGSSGSFKLPYRYKKGQQYLRKKTLKKDRYEYISSGTGMLQLSLLSAVGAAVFMLVMNAVFMDRFSTKYVSNGIKDRTDAYVRILAQGGISSLFNRYEAKGGLSQGRLGGISSVAPDYETDLVVRFVPTYTYSRKNMNPIYLKAYTGVYYRDNRFSNIRPDGTGNFDCVHEDTYMPVGAEYMDTGNGAFIKMFVLNKDADNTFDYRPYYSVYSGSGRNETSRGISDGLSVSSDKMMGLSEMVIRDGSALRQWADSHTDEGENPTSYELIYTPYTHGDDILPNSEITDEYERYVYDNYLDIPEDLAGILHETARDAGIIDPDDRISDAVSKDHSAVDCASLLRRYFKEYFQYSMLPGASPMNRDALEYFLSEQKRGFCVHFAASGALILRAAGIPTRYVEGYVINPSDITESGIERVNADDWIIANNSGSGEAVAVSDVEIPDANAHAWVEIYVDGCGWIPYELTPPSQDEDISYIGFADFFARLFAVTERGYAGEDNSGTSDLSPGTVKNSGKISKLLGGMDYLMVPMAVMLGLIGITLLTIYATDPVKKQIMIMRYLRLGDYDDALLVHYKDMVKKLTETGSIREDNPTVSEVHDAVSVLLPDADKELFDSVQQAAFACQNTDRQTYITAKKRIKDMISGIRKQTKRTRK